MGEGDHREAKEDGMGELRRLHNGGYVMGARGGKRDVALCRGSEGAHLGRAGSGNVPALCEVQDETVAVAAGANFSLAIGGKGEVYSFGLANLVGQLGRQGDGASGLVDGLAGFEVKMVRAGKFHAAAVTKDGALMTWGYNKYGQLGREVSASASEGGTFDAMPGRSWGPWGGNPIVVSVACGAYSTLAINVLNELFTIGFDRCGGEMPAEGAPLHPARRVRGVLEGRAIGQMAIGHNHWLAVTFEGEIFSCDMRKTKGEVNEHGELGRVATAANEVAHVAGGLCNNDGAPSDKQNCELPAYHGCDY
eukprot:gene19091-22826_t